MSRGVTTPITVRELYVEVHHMRGNVSKIEALNPHTGEWVEADVWNFRKATDEYWLVGDLIYKNTIIQAKLDNKVYVDALRITRYPDLERDMEDTTFHPSIPAWKIDSIKVEEFFNNGI